MTIRISSDLIKFNHFFGEGTKPAWASKFDDSDIEIFLGLIIPAAYISVTTYDGQTNITFQADNDEQTPDMTFKVISELTTIDTSNLIILDLDEDGYAGPTEVMLEINKELRAFGLDPTSWVIFPAFDMWFVRVDDPTFWVTRRLACEPGKEHIGWVSVVREQT